MSPFLTNLLYENIYIIDNKKENFNMNENKIIVNSGNTIIGSTKRKQTIKTMQVNKNMLDEMQSNYDRLEHGYNTNTNFTNSSNSNGTNNINISNLLPLISALSTKGSMNNILEILPKLSQNQNNSNVNMLSQLLPIIQNLQTKKTHETKKIDSLTRADETNQ